MLASKPRQNNRCVALAIIPFMTWCAEFSASNTSTLSFFGTSILSPYMGTPSRQYSWSAIDQNWWIFASSSWRDVVNPSCMYVANVRHSSSVAAAATILSQVIARSLGSCVYAAMINALLIRSTCWTASIVVSLCFGEVGYLEVQSGAALSFPGTCLIRNLSFVNLDPASIIFQCFSPHWVLILWDIGSASGRENTWCQSYYNQLRDTLLCSSQMFLPPPQSAEQCSFSILWRDYPV